MALQQQRSPWDELTPDGSSVADMIRKKLVSPTTMPPVQQGQQGRFVAPPRETDQPPTVASGNNTDQISAMGGADRPRTVNPSPGAGLPDSARAKILALLTNAGPASTTESDPNTVSPNPQPTQPIPYPGIATDEQATQTRPAIVGGSLETDALKREAARIQTMIANPTREVSPTGEAGLSHPFSKKKAALLGLLKGMGTAAEGHEYPSLARVLAGGATGATIGLVKPDAIQEWQRRGEVEDARSDLAQQTKTAMQQSALEDQQAQTQQRTLAPAITQAELERKARYDRDRLKIQQDVATGRISTAEANRRFNEQKLKQDREQKELDRTSREKIATLKPQTEIPDVAGQNAPDIKTSEDRISQYQTELAQHQAEIVAKHGAWKKQSEGEYQADLKKWQIVKDAYDKDSNNPKPGVAPKRKDYFDAAQNNDPDFLSGDYEKVNIRVKELQTAINKEIENRDQLKREVRQSQAKPRPRTGTAPKKYQTLNDAIQGFKNSPKNTTHRDPTASEVEVLKRTYGVQ